MPTPPASSKSRVQNGQALAEKTASGADDIKVNASTEMRIQVNSAKTCVSQAKRNAVLVLLGLSTLVLAGCLVFVKQSLDEVRLELQAVRQALPKPALSDDIFDGPEVYTVDGPEEDTVPKTVDGPEEDTVPKTKGRRLETMGNIAAYAGSSRVAGCVTIADLNSGDLTLTVSGDACGSGGSVRCPTCYIISDAHATNSLILAATSAMKMGTAGAAMGESGTSYTNSLTSVLFINADATDYQRVSDGTATQLLAPLSHLRAFAYTGASNRLYFASNYFLNGLYTGTGYLGTGADLTNAGALNLDGAATLAGTNTLSGTTTISGAATLSGGATLSGTNTLSGTTTISGAATLSGSTTAISGAATLSGGTTFSANVVSSGSTGFDFSGSTGLCKVANPWIVR